MKLTEELEKGTLLFPVQHNQISKWHISCLSNLVVGQSVLLMPAKKKKKKRIKLTAFIFIFFTLIEKMEGLRNKKNGELCKCKNEEH